MSLLDSIRRFFGRADDAMTEADYAAIDAVHHVEDLPQDLYEESFLFFNSLVSPWHQFLDPVRYNRHVDTIEALRPRAVASAHGPILVGNAIHDAFDRVRALAGEPIIAPPGQQALDEILAGAITEPA